MIKILKSLKYDKTQYDKHFGIFYHMALSKYDKKKPIGGGEGLDSYNHFFSSESSSTIGFFF